MGDWIGDNIGLLEMLMSAGIALAFAGWQYWQVRDAVKPPPPPSDHSARDPGHPEG